MLAGRLDKLAVTLHQRLNEIRCSRLQPQQAALFTVIKMTQDIVAPAPLPDQTSDHPDAMAWLGSSGSDRLHNGIETAARRRSRRLHRRSPNEWCVTASHQMVGVEQGCTLYAAGTPAAFPETVEFMRSARHSPSMADLETAL